jgi:hypothetical protein
MASNLQQSLAISYDSRFVPAHDKEFSAPVLLINEAPGPDEAASCIPLFGQQGANLFHAFRNAGILWALTHKKFRWPKNGEDRQNERHRQKKEFLITRAKHITCTNAYPYWPKPNDNSAQFCPPLESDVLSIKNIERIRDEICPNHEVILICGQYAYLACTGNELTHPSKRESSELTQIEIQRTNSRLKSNFKKGWYMGHTRRWSMNQRNISCALNCLAKYLNWPLSSLISEKK